MLDKITVRRICMEEKQMHKDSKWAKQIIALQEDDGKWGCFHTLYKYYGTPLTTEQALRRLERLGYSIEDECINKAVAYMSDCLNGKKAIPDRREKGCDWDIFSALMLAAWIRRFTHDDLTANEVAGQWGTILTSAFATGEYSREGYITAYRAMFGKRPCGGRLIDFVQFYTISLLHDCLDQKTENALLDYTIHHESGIYYIYDSRLDVPPPVFESKRASHYLAAIELLSKFPQAKYKLLFVLDWLNKNKTANGGWDMGRSAADKVYFPLSNDWRKRETREADCTERISNLITAMAI